MTLVVATQESEFKKAKDLKVTFDFAKDDSKDALHRSSQVQKLIAELILLSHKRGRPKLEGEKYEAAA